jgi:CMP-N-acetylneuraminic acid synthetase
VGKKIMKKKVSIAVWSCARLTSERCPKKMIKNFCGTSLTDIFLKKMQKLQKMGINVFFGGYDKIFEKKCKKYGIPFVQRSKKSSNSEKASEIYNFLSEQNYDYLLQVNACMPLLKVETILSFLNECKKIQKPAFGVYEINNYFMSNKDKPYNFNSKIKTINTKYVDKAKEFAHCFYFFKREYFKKNGWYWNWNKLKYITMAKTMETFDIDTKEDFEIGKILYKKFNKNL